MKIKYSKEKPELTGYEKNRIRNKNTGELEEVVVGRIVNFAIRETTEEDILNAWNDIYGNSNREPDKWFREEHRFVYYEILIPLGKWKYDEVVSAIIRDKYREDEMEAITNNMNMVVSEFFSTLVSEGIIQATKFLVESANGDSMNRFKEMQEWRAFAKKEAREIFNK